MAAVIGVELQPIPLIITEGRDFYWGFQNLNDNNSPTNFPAGRLFFELQTLGKNSAASSVVLRRANSGSFTLRFDGQTTSPLSFASSSSAVQTALESLSTIGSGNVSVSGLYYPEWVLTATFTGPAAGTLPANVQGAINAAVNGFLDTIEWLSGNAFTMTSTYSAPTWEFNVVANNGMDDNSLGAYVVDILNTGLQAILEAVSGIGPGNVVVGEQFYAPRREYSIQFTGDLAYQQLPPVTITPSLTGYSPTGTASVVSAGSNGLTIWEFDISGSSATVKAESEEVALIQSGTRWQLVFLPAGEAAGGYPVARGTVRVQQ